MRIDSLRRMICDKGGSVDDAEVVKSFQAGISMHFRSSWENTVVMMRAGKWKTSATVKNAALQPRDANR